MDLITQRLKLKDIFPDKVDQLTKKYKFDKEEPEFIRKGISLMPEDLELLEGERAVISHITTGAKDRDNEIVDPAGVMLDDYNNNRVVLFAHNHSELPIGENLWIKSDEKGLVAKTRYAKHQKAEDIWQYRKDGFPMAESIGFIPMEWTDFEKGTPEYESGIRRKYNKWILLEYSDVPIPSNPEALTIAVAKFPEFIKEFKNGADNLVNINSDINAGDDKDISENSDIEEKSGRVISAKNKTLINEALSAVKAVSTALNNLLEAAGSDNAEPETEEEGKILLISEEKTDDKIEINPEDVKVITAEIGKEQIKSVLRELMIDTINKKKGKV